MTLVAYITDGVIRCESDPDEGRRLPCVCSDPYCTCRTSPVAFRHEWFRSRVRYDPTGRRVRRQNYETWERGLWPLINPQQTKDLIMLATLSQQLRDLHVPHPVLRTTDSCAEAEATERTHEWVEIGAYQVCKTCPPALVACGHCSHANDDAWTPYPCPTLQVLDDALSEGRD